MSCKRYPEDLNRWSFNYLKDVSRIFRDVSAGLYRMNITFSFMTWIITFELCQALLWNIYYYLFHDKKNKFSKPNL